MEIICKREKSISQFKSELSNIKVEIIVYSISQIFNIALIVLLLFNINSDLSPFIILFLLLFIIIAYNIVKLIKDFIEIKAKINLLCEKEVK